MAQPRRVQMVAQQIHREVASMLLNDTTLRAAVQPEHALGADKVMSAIATISDVELSADLQVAKVYVSVYGDERGQAIAMEGLRAKAPYVRSGLGKKMRLRFAPEVRFIQDDSMERGSRVLSILSRLKAEQQARERGEPLPPNLSPVGSGGYDDEDEEEEELGRAVKAQKKPKKGQVEGGVGGRGGGQGKGQGRGGKKGAGRRWEGDDGVESSDFGEDENVFLVE
ncbi:unnamed protein product [Closterium sp. Yama58-4]|nr:unnamed protein product [Closterium sp. Yama58-4]